MNRMLWVPIVGTVSNPWREAIEVSASSSASLISSFPILGGRLLKMKTLNGS